MWEDDGVFEDPITVAKGRKQYEPQWVSTYCLFEYILASGIKLDSRSLDLYSSCIHALNGTIVRPRSHVLHH